MAASNTLFPCFKTTGDDKHDIDIYTEDFRGYCVMQNWCDSLKKTEAQRWTKPDKAIACLRASLPSPARAIYRYSLGLSDGDQKKPHLLVDALRKFMAPASESLGRGKNLFVYFKRKMSRSLPGKREFVIKERSASMKILQTNL